MENVPATFLKNPSPPLNQTLNLIFDVTLHIKINLSSYWRTPTKPAAILIPSTNDDSTCIPAKESGVQNMWNHVKKYWCKQNTSFRYSCFDCNLIITSKIIPTLEGLFPLTFLMLSCLTLKINLENLFERGGVCMYKDYSRYSTYKHHHVQFCLDGQLAKVNKHLHLL